MTAGRPISEDDLHAYVDIALDAPRHGEVETYLAQHPEVGQRVRGMIAQRAQLRAALAPIAQEPVPPELSLARLVEAHRRPRIVSFRAAAAAVLLLAVGGGAGWYGHAMTQQPSSGIAALAGEASDSYAVYASDHTHPVELGAGDRAELVSWMSDRLQHPVAVPDLSDAGYRLMGGRLVATDHGPAALFMYDDDHGTRLVMLMRQMATDKNMPMAPDTRGSTSGFTWARDGVGYSLVGPKPLDVLHPIADEVRRQVDQKV
jgi:anti-sigma factor RsiW